MDKLLVPPAPSNLLRSAGVTRGASNQKQEQNWTNVPSWIFIPSNWITRTVLLQMCFKNNCETRGDLMSCCFCLVPSPLPGPVITCYALLSSSDLPIRSPLITIGWKQKEKCFCYFLLLRPNWDEYRGPTHLFARNRCSRGMLFQLTCFKPFYSSCGFEEI